MTDPYARAILDAADRLFYARGVQAVGMDAVRTEAGVSLKALYARFPSKAELVRAYLERRDRQWREWLREHVERHSASPGERLLAVFDALDSWFHSPRFRGCAFVNVAGELGVAEETSRQAARHKQAVEGYLVGLATAAGLDDPERLAEQLMILIEGAISRAHVSGELSAGQTAGRMARLLLGQAHPGTATGLVSRSKTG